MTLPNYIHKNIQTDNIQTFIVVIIWKKLLQSLSINTNTFLIHALYFE